MRIPTPLAMSAVVVAGLMASGSATNTVTSSTPPEAAEPRLSADSGAQPSDPETPDDEVTQTLGMLPVSAEPPRKLSALSPAEEVPPLGGTVPLHTVTLPTTGGALGIPEIVLAAYRNAELAMETSTPGCGVSWNLLAGIGRIESGHARSGRTDAAGTTVSPIYGPTLDGSLPGNEVIPSSEHGSYVRALGPMQFLPGTWDRYQADGNGDGTADPHNVFDAALGSAKYLCSGGLDLHDRAQELKAVLRYNNSMTYAADVLSWSAAYRSGGSPSAIPVSPDLVPPGSTPTAPGPDMLAVDTTTDTDPDIPPPPPPVPDGTRQPVEPMIRVPGLPPIPCGILCPPAPSGPPTPVPAPMPEPEQQATPEEPAQPPREPGPDSSAPDPQIQAQQPNPPAPQPAPKPEAEPEPAPAPAPAPPPPGVQLPFGIVVPLPPGR